MTRHWLAALLLGAATVLGFAPFEVFFLPILTLALLFLLWQRSQTPGQAAVLGFAWGMGLFLAGTSWVYVSLHDVGGMAAPLAAAATLAFCVVLAAFPALAGYVVGRWRSEDRWRNALLSAGLWTLAEWLRGWILTGFPWLAIGYSQTPPSPLAGFAPLFGVYGVGFLTTVVAALLSVGWRRWLPLVAAVAILLVGWGLSRIAWTEPVGEPVTVSLLQGNIPQSLKWVPERLPMSIEAYTRLAAEHPARLTVLPETALPMLFDAIPREVLRDLTRNGDVLIGAAIGTRAGGYANGAVAVAADLSVQAYSKVHLVPFGEFVPPGFEWFFGLVDIPMSGFTPGSRGQPPLTVAGQRLLPNICYEDLFGEEIIANLSMATLLVNLSNTAWFGDSLAQPQHLQISRMRALETGRPMLRSTNTGMTAAIAADGSVMSVLPPFVRAALTVTVRGYAGSTPYARMGNAAVLLLAVLACLPALGQRRWWDMG
jgi:apolipoprotein N-acyltransferase